MTIRLRRRNHLKQERSPEKLTYHTHTPTHTLWQRDHNIGNDDVKLVSHRLQMWHRTNFPQITATVLNSCAVYKPSVLPFCSLFNWFTFPEWKLFQDRIKTRQLMKKSGHLLVHVGSNSTIDYGGKGTWGREKDPAWWAEMLGGGNRWKVMAAYCQLCAFGHLRVDWWGLGSAPEPDARFQYGTTNYYHCP